MVDADPEIQKRIEAQRAILDERRQQADKMKADESALKESKHLQEQIEHPRLAAFKGRAGSFAQKTKEFTKKEAHIGFEKFKEREKKKGQENKEFIKNFLSGKKNRKVTRRKLVSRRKIKHRRRAGPQQFQIINVPTRNSRA